MGVRCVVFVVRGVLIVVCCCMVRVVRCVLFVVLCVVLCGARGCLLVAVCVFVVCCFVFWYALSVVRCLLLLAPGACCLLRDGGCMLRVV